MSGTLLPTELRALYKMVGRLGIEPRTYWLKAKCSTIELTTRSLYYSVGALISFGGWHNPSSISNIA